ncbi:MAG TPA: hypothetical protein PLT86_02995 [Candidatus Latescibacteria bacterium]|nr:hypothetical protein [Candidatus Latescibacterota bacterium]
MPEFSISTQFVRYTVGTDAMNRAFTDVNTDTNYAIPAPCASIIKGGVEFRATEAWEADGLLHLAFGGSGVKARLMAHAEKHHIVLRVVAVDGEGVEEFTFAHIPLRLAGTLDDPFGASALALNLKTNVRELPGPMAQLCATCYAKFGFAGASVALVATPMDTLRKGMQEAVSAAPELPQSRVGGPWAMDAKITRGSYLFNFGDMSEEKADDWIALAQSLGITQIDFHGGNSFRFGDCRPNPVTYPNGFASLKAVIDKLHAAGISAGLHTYAFFIDKTCPWVTPVPDSRLAKDRILTLAAPIAADADTITVKEDTSGMSAITGFFVRNSNTLHIGDELITYTGVSKEAPYGFTGCTRGACGTAPAAHPAGAAVGHLKECFGLFVPDPETTLFEEVAAKATEAYNTCGFDMSYLDALDGEDILGGAEWAWHYGSRYVFEVAKRLKKPALFEMSTFHHHLWYVRARIGAWDHPGRSHKKFIDLHVASNEQGRRMFLPAHLGWWAVKTWHGHQTEPTFSDDIEYLCCKAVGTDTGFSVMGINPENRDKPVFQRLGAIMRRYEALRHSGTVPDAVKARLKEPGAEFTLVDTADGKSAFLPTQYDKHRVEGADGWSDSWTVNNPYAAQPVRLRIEALLSAEPYDSPNAITIADFTDPARFSDRAAYDGITLDLAPAEGGALFSAHNSNPPKPSAKKELRYSPTEHGVRVTQKADPSWAKAGATFDPPLNIDKHEALGLWIEGDGKGEVLNLQLKCPEHLVTGIGDHYVPITFTGRRFVTLIEPEGARADEYSWPYDGNVYALYREGIDYTQIRSVSLWFNAIPAGESVSCRLGPIKALPMRPVTLRNPSVIMGGQEITFPVGMKSGWYIEYAAGEPCILYDDQGTPVAEVTPRGAAPVLQHGENSVRFVCETDEHLPARAHVSVITRGEAIG